MLASTQIGHPNGCKWSIFWYFCVFENSDYGIMLIHPIMFLHAHQRTGPEISRDFIWPLLYSI